MSLRRRLAKKWHGLNNSLRHKHAQEQWVMAILPCAAHQGPEQVLSQPVDLTQWTLIEPPQGWFYADPFLVGDGDRVHCFYEASRIQPVMGHLEVITFDLQGRILEPARIVLQCPYHLSYPFVFQVDGQWYLMPESCGNQNIEVWIATDFPHQWAPHHVAIPNIHAVDATLHQGEDRWWLFAAVKQDCRKFGNRLFAWHADHPLSTHWTPHAQNPIREGLVYDRPAGALFRQGERWVRPAQDSVKRYGGAIEFRAIDTLTPEAYAETPIGRLEFPTDSGFFGVHTLNACPGMLAIDLLRLLPPASA